MAQERGHLAHLLRWTACAVLAVSLTPAARAQLAADTLEAEQGTVDAPTTPRDVIDFEANAAATIVTQTFSLFGEGPILVNGRSTTLGAANAALAIDSSGRAAPADLGTPGSEFGGPGVGDGGRAGGAFENRARLGNVLTVAESLTDTDQDGRIDGPGDADGALEAVLDLDFSAVGPVVMHSLTLIDVDSPTATVVLYTHNGVPLRAVELPRVGTDGVAVVDLGDVRGVYSMRVRLDGSGAIDDIVFSRDHAGRIESSVWFDRNADGLHGDDEPGLAGVRVTLGDAFGRLVDVAVTRHDGTFAFRRLIAGPYTVQIDRSTVPARFFPTLSDVGTDDSLDSDASPATVVLVSNDSVDDSVGFGLASKCDSSIGDLVWHDVNGDGLQDEGEPGLQGIRVLLFEDDFGDSDDYEEQFTGPNGFYEFAGLCPGEYTIVIDEKTLPPFFTETICDAGPDSIDSECSPHEVELDYGWSYTGGDFGFLSEFTGRIGDFVWVDDDCDGFQDVFVVSFGPATEEGLEGVGLILRDDMGIVIAETTSGMEGEYEFTGLAPGVYTVEIDSLTIAEGLVESPCNPGLNDETDNDCSGVEVTLLASAPGQPAGSPSEGSGGHGPTSTAIFDFGYRNDPCGGSGCARGFWKSFPDTWPAPFTPDTLFDDVFEKAYPGLTLQDVLCLDGDVLNALARQAVASLLNAASPVIGFPLSEEEVLGLWEEAYRLRHLPQQALLPERGRYLQFLNEQICALAGD